MSVSMTNTVNKKYRNRAGLIILGLLVFILAPFAVPQGTVSAGTEIGSSITNGATEIYLEQATYYKENRLLEVAVLSQGKEFNGQALDINVVAMNQKNKKYPITQEAINDYYTVIFITDVPEDFKQVKVTLSDNAKSSDMFEATLDPLFITPKNAEIQNRFTVKSAKSYQENYLNGLITIQENYLKTIDDEISKLNAQIEKLEQSSSDVTKDVELMTGAEKQKAMDKIKQNTSQITQVKKQIEAKEEEKLEYKEKIDRVENAR